MKPRSFVLLLTLILAAFPLRAQWSGSADLAASLHSRYGMTYEMKLKRFRYRMSNAVTRRIREIDQTWTNEEIEGRLYKVFHWVNAADSWSFGTAHRVGYEGKSFKAGVGVEYNQSRRTARTDGARKDASDRRLIRPVTGPFSG